jgi:hypothetical protein
LKPIETKSGLSRHRGNLGQMDDRPNPALLTKPRPALDVLEECSHLGLDEQGASRIRRILLRQIAKTERALACQSAPAAPFECEVFVEYSIARSLHASGRLCAGKRLESLFSLKDAWEAGNALLD